MSLLLVMTINRQLMMGDTNRMWKVIVLQLVVVSLCFAQSPLGSALGKNDTLDKLFNDYFEWKLRSYPEWATQEGFEGFNHLVEDYSMDAINAKEEDCKTFLDRISLLSPENENYEIYKTIFQVTIANSFSTVLFNDKRFLCLLTSPLFLCL